MSKAARFPQAVPRHLQAVELCMQRRWWSEALILLVSCIDRLTWLWLPRRHQSIEPRLQRTWLARYIVEPGFDACGLDQLVDLIERTRAPHGAEPARSAPSAMVVFEPACAVAVRHTLDCAGLRHVALVPFGSLASAVARAAVAFVEDARRDGAGWNTVCDRAEHFAEADASLMRFVAAVESGHDRRSPGAAGLDDSLQLRR